MVVYCMNSNQLLPSSLETKLAYWDSKRMLPLPIAEHDVKNKHADVNLHCDQSIISLGYQL
jgi:hypothetical protein